MRRRVIPLLLAIAALACARPQDPSRRAVSQEPLSLRGANVIRYPVDTQFVETGREIVKGRRLADGRCHFEHSVHVSPGQRGGGRMLEHDPTTCTYLFASGHSRDAVPDTSVRRSGQVPSPEPRALQVALDTVRAVMFKRQLMIVPDTLGNTDLARMAAAFVGGGVRSASDGMACRGAFIPRCPFPSTLDTVSIRIHPREVTQDSVQLAIDAWGLMHIRRDTGPVELFYERRIVTVVRREGEWRVAEVKVDFVT